MIPTTLQVLSAIPWGFKYHGSFTSLKLKLEPERAKVLFKRFPSAMVYHTKKGKAIIAWQGTEKQEYWNSILTVIKNTKKVRRQKQLVLF